MSNDLFRQRDDLVNALQLPFDITHGLFVDVDDPAILVCTQLRPEGVVAQVLVEYIKEHLVLVRMFPRRLAPTDGDIAVFLEELHDCLPEELLIGNRGEIALGMYANPKDVSSVIALVLRVAADLNEFLDYVVTTPAFRCMSERWLDVYLRFHAYPDRGIDAAIVETADEPF